MPTLSEEECAPETEPAPLSNEQLLALDNAELREQLRRTNTVLASIVKSAKEIFVHKEMSETLDGRDEVHFETVGDTIRYWHERVGE